MKIFPTVIYIYSSGIGRHFSQSIKTDNKFVILATKGPFALKTDTYAEIDLTRSSGITIYFKVVESF
jgi:hypothetical protein